MSEANKAVVRELLEAINRRDIEGAAAFLAADYVWQGPGSQQAFGPEGWKELVATYLAAFPDLQFTLDDICADADKVAARFTARGTFKGELAGVSPTGRTVSVPCIMISRIENGKIVEDHEMWDQLTMFQDLGALAELVAHAGDQANINRDLRRG